MKKNIPVLLLIIIALSSISRLFAEDLGDDIRAQILSFKEWEARLKQFETYYSDEIKKLPPFFLVYSTDILQGKINLRNETVTLNVQMYALPEPEWFEKINNECRSLAEELRSVRGSEEWELDWPVQSITSPNPFGSFLSNFSVTIEIINSQEKSIGSQTANIPYGWYSTSRNVILPRIDIIGTKGKIIIPVQGIRADSIIGDLSIKITGIDDLPVEKALIQKRLTILTEKEHNDLPSTKEYGTSFENISNFLFNTGSRDMNIIYGTLRERAAQINSGFTRIPYGTTQLDRRTNTSFTFEEVYIPSSVEKINAPLGNNLKRILIGSNVELTFGDLNRRDNLTYGFPGFAAFYIQNNQKAGLYENNGVLWAYYSDSGEAEAALKPVLPQLPVKSPVEQAWERERIKAERGAKFWGSFSFSFYANFIDSMIIIGSFLSEDDDKNYNYALFGDYMGFNAGLEFGFYGFYTGIYGLAELPGNFGFEIPVGYTIFPIGFDDLSNITFSIAGGMGMLSGDSFKINSYYPFFEVNAKLAVLKAGVKLYFPKKNGKTSPRFDTNFGLNFFFGPRFNYSYN